MTGARQRAVLWDLDGTLVDSEEYHWRAWRETMAAEGMTLTREQFLASFGQRNDAILREWLQERATPEAIRKIGDAKEACYRRLVRTLGLAAAPGAAEWVHRLHEEQWAQAVASSAPRLNVETVLEVTGLAPYFGATVAAEDVRHGKPDPEVFLVAAERLGVPPDRCVVVEDAPAGIEAARRARMRTIGLIRGNCALAADLVVRSLAELPPGAFAMLLER